MKKTIYIFLAFVFALTSCSMTEMDPVESGRDGYVEFIARPMSFTGYNVGGVSTKAYTEEQMTDLESAIYSAYLLIYKPNGELIGDVINIDIDPATGVIPAQKIKNDPSYNDVTVCLLANVPYDYAHSLDTYEAFQTTPLPIEYADYETTGYIGVPKMTLTLKSNKLDETTVKECFPMCGIHHGKFGASDQVVIPLERLFAKVQVNFSMDMGTKLLDGAIGGALDDFFGDLFGDITLGNTAENARFEMSGYSLSGIPNHVLLGTPTESPWVKDGSYFEDATTFNVETTIYDLSNPYTDGGKNPAYPISLSFEFYTPEYVLLPESAKVTEHQSKDNKERFKPALFAEDKLPLFLTFEGRLHDHGGSYANVKYNVYFGENNYDSFSLLRNNLYTNNLVIKDIGHLTADQRVDVLPLNLVEAYGQAANCYIISIPGEYELDAYQGVVKADGLASAPKFVGKPYTVWNTTENVNVITYHDAQTSQDKIVFEVAGSDNAITPGNALIAIRDDNDNILWSWHLWFCEPDSRPDNTDYQHTYPDSNSKLMNRSLGATVSVGSSILSAFKEIGYDLSIWSDGLYYQWGRKDPVRLNGTSVTSSASESTYSKSVMNPNTFYLDWDATGAGWSNVKSTDDPCPPGYKVPTPNAWRNSLNTGTGEKLTATLLGDYFPYNIGVSYDLTTNIVFPYNNYIDGATGHLDEEHPRIATLTVAGPIECVNLSNPRRGRVRLTDVVINLHLSTELGGFWAHDSEPTSMRFGYSGGVNLSDVFQGVDALREKVDIVEAMASEGSGIISVKWGTPYKITSLTDLEKTGVLTSLLTKSVSDEYTYNKDYRDYSPSTGLQVRCIME